MRCIRSSFLPQGFIRGTAISIGQRKCFPLWKNGRSWGKSVWTRCGVTYLLTYRKRRLNVSWILPSKSVNQRFFTPRSRRLRLPGSCEDILTVIWFTGIPADSIWRSIWIRTAMSLSGRMWCGIRRFRRQPDRCLRIGFS